MGLRDKLADLFGPLPPEPAEQKAYMADGMMVTASYQAASWMAGDYESLVAEGFLKNSAFSACVSTFVFAFPEAPLVVKNKAGTDQDNHPLQQLLRRPTPQCGEAELMQILANYLMVGGNAYVYKARSGAGNNGRVKELWPFSVAQMWPVPPSGIGGLIEYYQYRKPNGETNTIPAKDIIHLKWPVSDPYAPYMGLAPLRLVAREVDTDNEATVYLKALLQNDAAPRTILTFPDGTYLAPEAQELLSAQFGMRHGGDRRGGVSIVTGGATVSRMGMNLQELAFDALRAVPEARICAVCRTPPIVAGLNVGLEHAIYSNIEQASKDYTNRLLVPMWHMVASEFESDLVPEFGVAGSLTIDHDISRVAAMQEDSTAKNSRAVAAYKEGIMMLNEAREHIGLDPVPDGDTFKAPPAPPQMPGQQPVIDVQPVPPRQLTDQAAKALYTMAVKEMKAKSTEPMERRMQRVVHEYLNGQVDDYAAAGGEG